MKVKTFDREFDTSEDVLTALDLSSRKRPLRKSKRVNVDSPTWMVAALADAVRGVRLHGITVPGW